MEDVEVISNLPNKFKGTFKCVYPTCITNKPKEPITPRFVVLQRKPLRLQCDYCSRYIDQGQLQDQIDEIRKEEP